MPQSKYLNSYPSSRKNFLKLIDWEIAVFPSSITTDVWDKAVKNNIDRSRAENINILQMPYTLRKKSQNSIFVVHFHCSKIFPFLCLKILIQIISETKCRPRVQNNVASAYFQSSLLKALADNKKWIAAGLWRVSFKKNL